MLSRYGAYSSSAQAAAVDAATYHYLWGGTLAWTGKRGAQRIRQTGSHAAQVRSLTRQMIATANIHAGPVRVGVSAPATTVGGYVTVTVTVVDGGGYRQARAKVRATFRGKSMDGTTDSRGQARFQFPAGAGGTATVTGAALGVPSHYLQVKRARSSRQANAIIAGRKTQRRPVDHGADLGQPGVGDRLDGIDRDQPADLDRPVHRERSRRLSDRDDRHLRPVLVCLGGLVHRHGAGASYADDHRERDVHLSGCAGAAHGRLLQAAGDLVRQQPEQPDQHVRGAVHQPRRRHRHLPPGR
ncbi:hypothetical protein G5V59_27360 [Nocardioides sp. W3-2-3]|uniref:hypothetical protein n=1 Tax=Nocardioides convexus TaxID=2712224 RepID=UPI0024185BFB|nr:hypothetical protein [Nocardioides convexus]NHA02101.1 hypothetical protein [Nocardioides convexus]